MLTPQELRNIPEDVVSIFEECEDEILRLIGERIRAVGYLNTVSLWQLIKRKESLLFKRNVTRTLSKYTGLSQRQIRRVFKKAGAKALLHDDTFLKAITTKDTRKRTRALDKILKEAYEQTNGTLHNWTGTTANNATNHFVHAMDKAALQVQSGAFSYDEAIRRATRDLADHMDYVTYESGHKDTLEVASRRAVRTGVNQMASKLTLERCKQVGAEFVETTAHVGARETDSEDCTNHSWWQGKVFHLSEEGSVGEDGKFYPGFFSYDQAGYGYGAGICGWNCRHSFHPFIPGVSEPIYTPEELTKLNEKNIEYEGQKYSRYEIDQKQRGLERQVRKYKRREILAESVGDEQEVMRNRAFVRKYQDELEKFTKETGNRRDYERERETVGKDIPNNQINSEMRDAYLPKMIKKLLNRDNTHDDFSENVKREDSKVIEQFSNDFDGYIPAKLVKGEESCCSIFTKVDNNHWRIEREIVNAEMASGETNVDIGNPALANSIHERMHDIINQVLMRRAGLGDGLIIDNSQKYIFELERERFIRNAFIECFSEFDDDKEIYKTIDSEISFRAMTPIEMFCESAVQYKGKKEYSIYAERLYNYVIREWKK